MDNSDYYGSGIILKNGQKIQKVENLSQINWSHGERLGKHFFLKIVESFIRDPVTCRFRPARCQFFFLEFAGSFVIFHSKNFKAVLEGARNWGIVFRILMLFISCSRCFRFIFDLSFYSTKFRVLIHIDKLHYWGLFFLKERYFFLY